VRLIGESVKNQSNKDQLLVEWQQIALAAAFVERMSSNYFLFTEVSGAGDSQVYRNILSLVWEFVSGKNQRIDFQKQLDKLELITPDTSDFDMYGVWPALDAAVALASLLSCCERWDQAEFDSIIRLSYATIENYLEVTGNISVNDHPLLVSERHFTDELQTVIDGLGSKGRGVIAAELKALVIGGGVSNIGLELT
jgi:uncharacterized protein YjaG (DUF416 family)